MQEDHWAITGIGFASEGGDAAVGVLAMNDFGGKTSGDPHSTIQHRRQCQHQVPV